MEETSGNSSIQTIFYYIMNKTGPQKLKQLNLKM